MLSFPPLGLGNGRDILAVGLRRIAGETKQFAVIKRRLAVQSVRDAMVVTELAGVKTGRASLAMTVRALKRSDFDLGGEFASHSLFALSFDD